MKTLPVIIAVLALSTVTARGEPLPLPKPLGPGGSCRAPRLSMRQGGERSL